MFAEPFDLYRALDPQAVQDVFCDAVEAAGATLENAGAKCEHGINMRGSSMCAFLERMEGWLANEKRFFARCMMARWVIKATNCKTCLDAWMKIHTPDCCEDPHVVCALRFAAPRQAAAAKAAEHQAKLEAVEAELARWQLGELKSVSVFDLDTGTSALEAAGSKRHRGGDAGATSGPSALQQLVAVKEEKTEAQRSLNVAQEDLEDSDQLVSQQALYTDFLQAKLNEMESLALRAGADPSTVSEIMARKYKA